MKEHVPIIEINRVNIHELLPHIRASISAAYFVALDCEMSGLGDRKKLNSKSVDERYLAMKEAASTRSLLAIGISCFSLRPTSKHNKLKVVATTYNVLSLCDQDYVVEPQSLEFLVKHDFDFNAQYMNGITYYPGADRCSKNAKSSSDGSDSECLRQLFNYLALSGKPLILHNSLVDLVFLYQNLYGPAPEDLHTFLAVLFELFPAGIYDTKYVADYCARTKASYLEYIFRKCQRENWLNTLNSHLSIRFPTLPDELNKWVEWSFCSSWSCNTFDASLAGRICSAFSLHGCCRTGSCKLIHDVDVAILAEEAKSEKKREKSRNRSLSRQSKRNLDHSPLASDATQESSSVASSKVSGRNEENMENGEQNCPLVNDLFELLNAKRSELLNSVAKKRKKEKTSKGDVAKDAENVCGPLESCQNTLKKYGERSFYKCAHRAGFDAFMTGYCIAFFALKHYGLKDGQSVEPDEFSIPDIKNQIALSGKDFSLTIQKSVFAKPSPYHDSKFRKLIKGV